MRFRADGPSTPITVGRDVLSSLASALFDLPSAAPRMIRARNAMRCSVLPDRTSRSSSCLASRVTANAALLAHMLGSLTRATRIVKHCVRHYTRAPFRCLPAIRKM